MCLVSDWKASSSLAIRIAWASSVEFGVDIGDGVGGAVGAVGGGASAGVEMEMNDDASVVMVVAKIFAVVGGCC